MGPLLVLVCPYFREIVIVTCKIVSFLCRLCSFHLKNVIVFFVFFFLFCFVSFFFFFFFFFEIKFQNGTHLKKGYFWPTFHIFSHQGKDTTIPSAHISLTSIHVFCSPCWLFALPSLQKLRIYHVWFLFGVTSGVDSYLRHFGAINK